MLWTGMPMEHDILVNGRGRVTFDWRNGGRGNGVRPILDKPLRLRAGRGEDAVAHPLEVVFRRSRSTLPTTWTRCLPLYSQSFAGGEWGNGATGNGDETQITVTGNPSDRVEIQTRVKLFENGGTALAAGDGYQSTFDIRGDHSRVQMTVASPTYLWSSSSSVALPAATADRRTSSPANVANTTLGDVSSAPRPFMVMDAQLKALDEDDLPNKHLVAVHSRPIASKGRPMPTGKTSVPCQWLQAELRVDQFLPSRHRNTCRSHRMTRPTLTSVEATRRTAASHGSAASRSRWPRSPRWRSSSTWHQASIDNLYSSGFLMQNHAIANSFALARRGLGFG